MLNWIILKILDLDFKIFETMIQSNALLWFTDLGYDFSQTIESVYNMFCRELYIKCSRKYKYVHDV